MRWGISFSKLLTTPPAHPRCCALILPVIFPALLPQDCRARIENAACPGGSEVWILVQAIMPEHLYREYYLFCRGECSKPCPCSPVRMLSRKGWGSGVRRGEVLVSINNSDYHEAIIPILHADERRSSLADFVMKRISFIGLETALTRCMQSVNNSQNIAWMLGLVGRRGAEQLGLSKIRALQSEERGLPKCCDPSTAKTATSTVWSRCWLRCHCECKPRVSAILQESETRRASR